MVEPSGSSGKDRALFWAWLVLAFAAMGLAGSLYLSMGLKLRACPLCFYQRTFIMAVFAVLVVGLAVDRSRAGLLCLLSLPLAFGGLGVAVFHEFLVMADKLECPTGILDLGTSPAQSLTIFVLLSGMAVAGAWAGSKDTPSYRPLLLLPAAVLGLLLAWGGIASAPPMPPAPTRPYDPAKEPLNICRPPYRVP